MTFFLWSPAIISRTVTLADWQMAFFEKLTSPLHFFAIDLLRISGLTFRAPGFRGPCIRHWNYPRLDRIQCGRNGFLSCTAQWGAVVDDNRLNISKQSSEGIWKVPSTKNNNKKPCLQLQIHQLLFPDHYPCHTCIEMSHCTP